jgi:hypothetical protein
LVFPAACTLLGQCLLVQGKGKDYVASYFSGMQGAVESPKFDRMVASKKAVEVQKVVSA